MSPLDRVADESVHGRRLDTVLAEWLGEPRARVQKRLAAGGVLVDGEAVAKGHRVRAGERVEVLPEPPADAVVLPPLPVRYGDEHVVVVAKPAGLVVHAGAGQPRATVVDALRSAGLSPAGGTDPDRPGIVHRLDRGTSGLLVVARTQAAYEGLVAQFSARAVERAYWALVEGVPDPPEATIDAPIGRSRRQRTRFAVDPDGRPAVSHYDVAEPFGAACAVHVRLETGRTHQVRVHMAAVGHPVVGDRTYGASPALASRLGLDHPALHARMLGFRHPVTGEHVALDEPLPADLEHALRLLRGAAG